MIRRAALWVLFAAWMIRGAGPGTTGGSGATAVVRLEPDENGPTSNWTKEGALANWAEVAQPTMQAGKKLKAGSTEEEAQAEKKPTEAEGKARGVKSSTPSQIQQFRISAKQVEEKIPAGATIKRIVFRWDGKPGLTQDKNQLEFGTLTEEMLLGGTAEVFHLGTVTKAHVEATTRASLIEKLQFQYQHATEGAGESRVNVVYVEVEYETAGEGGSTAPGMLSRLLAKTFRR